MCIDIQPAKWQRIRGHVIGNILLGHFFMQKSYWWTKDKVEMPLGKHTTCSPFLNLSFGLEVMKSPRLIQGLNRLSQNTALLQILCADVIYFRNEELERGTVGVVGTSRSGEVVESGVDNTSMRIGEMRKESEVG